MTPKLEGWETVESSLMRLIEDKGKRLMVVFREKKDIVEPHSGGFMHVQDNNGRETKENTTEAVICQNIDGTLIVRLQLVKPETQEELDKWSEALEYCIDLFGEIRDREKWLMKEPDPYKVLKLKVVNRMAFGEEED